MKTTRERNLETAKLNKMSGLRPSGKGIVRIFNKTINKEITTTLTIKELDLNNNRDNDNKTTTQTAQKRRHQ